MTRERHDGFAPSQPALATCKLLLSAIAISLVMAVATLGVQAAAGQIQQVVGQLTERRPVRPRQPGHAGSPAPDAHVSPACGRRSSLLEALRGSECQTV